MPESPSRSMVSSNGTDISNVCRSFPAKRNNIILANSSPTHTRFPVKERQTTRMWATNNSILRSKRNKENKCKIITALKGKKRFRFKETPILHQKSLGPIFKRIAPVNGIGMNGPLHRYNHGAPWHIIFAYPCILRRGIFRRKTHINLFPFHERASHSLLPLTFREECPKE